MRTSSKRFADGYAVEWIGNVGPTARLTFLTNELLLSGRLRFTGNGDGYCLASVVELPMTATWANENYQSSQSDESLL